jgi:hypothetical protein
VILKSAFAKNVHLLHIRSNITKQMQIVKTGIFFLCLLGMTVLGGAAPIFYTEFVVRETESGSVSVNSILTYINSLTTLVLDASQIRIHEKP